jgi:hypothetical protein
MLTRQHMQAHLACVRCAVVGYTQTHTHVSTVPRRRCCLRVCTHLPPQAQQEVASLLLPGESVAEGLRRLAAASSGASAGASGGGGVAASKGKGAPGQVLGARACMRGARASTKAAARWQLVR